MHKSINKISFKFTYHQKCHRLELVDQRLLSNETHPGENTSRKCTEKDIQMIIKYIENSKNSATSRQGWWKRGGVSPFDFGRIEGADITTCPPRFLELAPSMQGNYVLTGSDAACRGGGRLAPYNNSLPLEIFRPS